MHLGLAATAFLIAFALLDIPAAAGASPTVGAWEGIWSTSRGEVMLVQRGAQVTGSFTAGGGRLVGHASQLTLAGTWSDSGISTASTDSGHFAWTITRSGRSFTGQWRYASASRWSGTWQGRFVSLPPV